LAKEHFRDLFQARPENGLLSLAAVDPDDTHGLKRKQADGELFQNAARLGELQERVYAEATRSLLVVLQAVDTGGKDGTIRHAMSGLNPQGARVVAFKVPTPQEAAHHFLWRIRRAAPHPREVVIFNRSHYEDVIVPKVKKTIPDEQITRRYAEINRFERGLRESGTHIVKLCLHISYDEQRKRLKRRLLDPTKRWKFSENDLKERGYWDDYQSAYGAAINATSMDIAPWYIIPANHKWFRNWAVSHILIETLVEMDPHYPEVKLKVRQLLKKLDAERTPHRAAAIRLRPNSRRRATPA
jgi:PPK2 family polyphosphate:nucleotide phosphotransferase